MAFDKNMFICAILDYFIMIVIRLESSCIFILLAIHFEDTVLFILFGILAGLGVFGSIWDIVVWKKNTSKILVRKFEVELMKDYSETLNGFSNYMRDALDKER